MMSTLNARAAWKGGDTVSTFNANSPPMDFMSKKSKGTKVTTVCPVQFITLMYQKTDSTPGAGGPEVRKKSGTFSPNNAEF